MNLNLKKLLGHTFDDENIIGKKVFYSCYFYFTCYFSK